MPKLKRPNVLALEVSLLGMSPDKKKAAASYTAEDIYVLEGLEPVRKRPGMYIGSTGADGLHHLIWEVVDNSIDEAMAGFCTAITVTLLAQHGVRVTDNGRGIPVEQHKKTKKSALETVMTTLHAGAKFGGKGYQVSGGLHGVGVSVVNALSEKMVVEVCRDSKRFRQEYVRGKARDGVKRAGACVETGTSVEFWPDPEIFGKEGDMPQYGLRRVFDHLRQQAYLTEGVKITVLDERPEGEREAGLPNAYTFYFEGGVAAYVKFLNRNKRAEHETIFAVKETFEDILVETAFQYTDDINTIELAFANNIHTMEGGAHLTGFRTALTRTLNRYAQENNLISKVKETENLSGEDTLEGLTAIVSVKLKDPQFEGQTKAKLGNPSARKAVDTVVGEAFSSFIKQNASEASKIIQKCLLAQRARKKARAVRDTILRKGVLSGLTLPGKLTDCASRDPAESELFIVEGDSAGGCFSGGTKVALLDGRNLSFRQLLIESKQGKRHFCYTILTDGTVGVAPIQNPRRTKRDTPVVQVKLDNEEEIVCTPEHRFMLRDGTYRQAVDLNPGDSLMPLRKQLSRKGQRITIEGYELVFDPNQMRWIFTHLLADKYNLTAGVYQEKDGEHRHHIDFNKLNNNPDNINRLPKEEHLRLHADNAERTILRNDVQEKMAALHKTPAFRAKIREAMTTPAMKKMLSARAKQQWQNPGYQAYMREKFQAFYSSNKNYREQNLARLFQNQAEYWAVAENRNHQAERVRAYFNKFPAKKAELSIKAKEQWGNKLLRQWRAQVTKRQWTPEFRLKRNRAYNQNYLQKALAVLSRIYLKQGSIDEEDYNKVRQETNDKTLLKLSTIRTRFFNGNERALVEAVQNFNHKVKSVTMLKQRIDVYDIEVPGTHNFALASGVFVHNSAKQGRNPRFQAVLPLRGKILNVERARLSRMLDSKEIKALIIALGTAISEEFELAKLRYHKVIIATDADVDGAHIATLLLTLFFRYFRPVIDAGHVYLAQPPLYRIDVGKELHYAYSDDEKARVIEAIMKAKPAAKPSIQRYKGLGEMNPEQLWETTMDPSTRTLAQVSIDDAEAADRLFDILMGSEVPPRKKFIQTHAKSVANLDV